MMMEGEIERALNVGRTTRAIQHLDGHVVLCGFGRIGRILAQELRNKRQAFVVVDNQADAVGEAQNLDYLVLSATPPRKRCCAPPASSVPRRWSRRCPATPPTCSSP